MYWFFNIFGGAMLFAYNLLHYKEKKQLLSEISQTAIKRFAAKEQKGIYRILSKIGFWVVVETLILYVVQHPSGLVFGSIFGAIVKTGANYFGIAFFSPLLLMLFCALVKIDPLAQMDLVAPGYALALIFTKIACYFAGCCRGVPWENGFYNPISRVVEFPVQLLEAAAAVLIFAFLQIFKKKFKKGTVLPIYLISYSTLRFFTEFFRVEPKVFMGLRVYQILCIAGVIVGVLECFAARKYDTYIKKKADPCHSEEKGQGGNSLD